MNDVVEDEAQAVEYSKAKPSKYLTINPRILRSEYGTGRQAFKWSVTLETQKTLEEMGVVQLRDGKQPGTRVAVKGGFGSAFIEFMVTVFAFLLTRNAEKVHARVVSALIRDIFDSQESIQIVKQNLMALVEEL